MENWSTERKIKYDMNLIEELHRNYLLVCMLFLVCIERGLKLIMENPYSEEHFLRRYWCVSPSIIDKDRRENGDYYAKPTQYWFLNCKPENNILLEGIERNSVNVKDANRMMKEEHYGSFAKNRKQARSMIHPTYANRFIRQYILGENVNKNNQLSLFDE